MSGDMTAISCARCEWRGPVGHDGYCLECGVMVLDWNPLFLAGWLARSWEELKLWAPGSALSKALAVQAGAEGR